MATNFQTSSLVQLDTELHGPSGRLGLLHEAIDVLQGHGDPMLNAVVNDLVSLRRELSKSMPDKEQVKTLLVSIYNRSDKVSSDHPSVTRAIAELQRISRKVLS